MVIGIGGSYLGARAVIELLGSNNYNLKKKDTPNIYFAGNGLSGDAMQEIFDLIGDDDFSVNVISKSGTTTEPAVAFRFFIIGGQDLDLLALGVEVVPGGGVLPGGVAVHSKSGTTTEPAVAFRFFKAKLEEKYGKAEAAKRIYATTDKARGALKSLPRALLSPWIFLAAALMRAYSALS